MQENSIKMVRGGQSERLVPPVGDTVRPFAEAYLTYSQAFQEAWTPDDFKQLGSEAYQQYLSAQQKVTQLAPHQQLLDAWKNYVGLVQETLRSTGMQQSAAESYRAYLQELRQAWLEADLENIGPRALVEISQNIMAAAWLAAAAEGIADTIGDQPAGPIL